MKMSIDTEFLSYFQIQNLINKLQKQGFHIHIKGHSLNYEISHDYLH